jgi:hypothetical protein
MAAGTLVTLSALQDGTTSRLPGGGYIVPGRLGQVFYPGPPERTVSFPAVTVARGGDIVDLLVARWPTLLPFFVPDNHALPEFPILSSIEETRLLLSVRDRLQRDGGDAQVMDVLDKILKV